MIKFGLYKILLSLLLINCLSTHTRAQENKSNIWLDVGAGIGVGAGSSKEMLTTTLGANYQKQNWLYKTRYGYSTEMDLLSKGSNLTELSFMLGKRKMQRLSHISATAGLGVAWGQRTKSSVTYIENTTLGTRENKSYTTLCIPFEAEYMFFPTKFIGIGIALNGNLNIYEPIFGAQIKLGLEKIR